MRGHSIRPVACRKARLLALPAAVSAARDGGGRDIREPASGLSVGDPFRGPAAGGMRAIGHPDWRFGAGAGCSHGVRLRRANHPDSGRSGI